MSRSKSFLVGGGVLGLAALASAGAWARARPATVPPSMQPPAVGRSTARTAQIDFDRDVRPILSDRCFPCHGPDEGTREADLRLDLDGGVGTAESPGVVVPGDLEHSPLWSRVTSARESRRMPPPEFAEALSEGELEVLRRWIEQGASVQQHWAYRPLIDPAVPEVEDAAGFVRDPLDRFVLAHAREQGFEPAPPADPATLLRRLALDLTGLPPEPEDLRAFVQDPSDERYLAMVDRYLASERHAERMTLWWLDLVRYGDTCGVHGDQDMSVSPYRDWVLAAFRDNLPFDRFTRDQLAGDLREGADLRSRVASCYNRLNLMTAEGGAQAEEYLAKYAADRVRNASVVWLGATMGCCECHDHKYDPLSTREFYEFAAFWSDVQQKGVYGGANWTENLPVPTPEQEGRLAELGERVAELERRAAEPTAEEWAAMPAWVEAQRQAVADRDAGWTLLVPEQLRSEGGARFEALDDGSWFVDGASPDVDVYTLEVRSPLPRLDALRLELLPDPRLPRQGPGRAGNGNLVLSEWIVRVDGQRRTLVRPSASHEQARSSHPSGRWSVEAAIDGDAHGATHGWAILPRTGRASEAVVHLDPPLEEAEGKVLELQLEQRHGSSHTLGRFRLWAGADPSLAAGPGSDLPAELVAALQLPSDQHDEGQRALLKDRFLGHSQTMAPARAARDAARKERKALEDEVLTCLITVPTTPRPTRILPRGDWMNQNGALVEPGVPAVFGEMRAEEGQRLDRLDLALWLTRPDHPATSRVLVNRLWKLLFGRGLSRVLDDFGGQGQPPTHPGLLDHLAVRMVEGGWDLRALLRGLVLSGSYRMSSQVSAEGRRLDPENDHLARQGRWRLEAEMVRDQALWVGGLLVEQFGGQSVRPYQPAGYYAQLNFPKREYESSTGPDQWRRGLYTHRQRTFPHPMLLAFDAPTREECCVERGRSNTPQQALVLLNDPSFVEAARGFAEWMLRREGDDSSRLAAAYRRTTAEEAPPEATALLAELLRRRRAEFAADPEAARALIAVGAAPVAEDLDPIELAAHTSVARALLNSARALTRR